MKKVILIATCLWVIAAVPGFCVCNCHTDELVQRWVKEKNTAAVTIARKWVRNAPMDDLATHGAVILSNQIYILSKCKDDEAFLKKNLFQDNDTNGQGGLELLPAQIIEKMTGQDFFSPVSLFDDVR
jgi:hypothetical protein